VVLPDCQAAEDALQEAWLDVWRGLPGYSHTRPFRPWLLAVIANRCRMTYRRRSLETVPLLPEYAEILPATTNVETDALQHEPDDEQLLAELANLAAEQRRVLELRYFADLDLAEIALVMNIPLGTVKSRLNRTLALLRSDLTDMSGERNPTQSGKRATTPSRANPATVREDTA
jgi:RNA polymerase sigma factor (sigma-70 family)